MNFYKKTCSFTGYRTQKLNKILMGMPHGTEQVRNLISQEIIRMIEDDFEIFKSGMAVGADTLFAEVVLEYKRKYPRIKLIAVVPCLEQEKLWAEKDKIKYHSILENADKVEIINNKPYFDGCMQIRNKNLVDNCNELLAVYDGRHGGTMQTVRYANKINRKVTVLDPVKLVRITMVGKDSYDWLK